MSARISIAGVELVIDNELEWKPAPTEDSAILRISGGLARALNRSYGRTWAPPFGVYVPDSTVARAEAVAEDFDGAVLETSFEPSRLQIY